MKAALVDERNDVARSDHPVHRVRPADERFDARELPGLDLHLRLVVDRERTRLQRALQLGRTQTDDRHLTLSMTSGRGGEQDVHESRRIHRHEVVCLFSDTEKLHRKLELLCDGEHRSALRGAVELRDDEARDRRR